MSSPTKSQNGIRHKYPTPSKTFSIKDCQSPPMRQKSRLDELDKGAIIKVGGKEVNIDADDLTTIGMLGKGAYGVVEKVKHTQTGTVLAVKRITATQNDIEKQRLLMDLDVLRNSDCPYIVHFYGAMFREGDVMICMEVMDLSLDKFYKVAKDANKLIPEEILGKIAFSVISALNYLHKKLQVIHRDVKPSNMLIDRRGNIKMCDFGISGYLKNSFAKTVGVGCKYYMAPERIDPQADRARYDTRSDIWSFGIAMIEISTGVFPYKSWPTPFEQQKQVVKEDPPSLPSKGMFSLTYQQFVRKALQKNVDDRPKPYQLLEDPFLLEHSKSQVDVASFVNDILYNFLDAVLEEI